MNWLVAGWFLVGLSIHFIMVVLTISVIWFFDFLL